ncbi:MAG: hypothetical protein ACI83O_000242 [Patescibacteria group bacterium]|jgi:hypothetical protein
MADLATKSRVDYSRHTDSNPRSVKNMDREYKRNIQILMESQSLSQDYSFDEVAFTPSSCAFESLLQNRFCLFGPQHSYVLSKGKNEGEKIPVLYHGTRYYFQPSHSYSEIESTLMDSMSSDISMYRGKCVDTLKNKSSSVNDLVNTYSDRLSGKFSDMENVCNSLLLMNYDQFENGMNAEQKKIVASIAKQSDLINSLSFESQFSSPNILEKYISSHLPNSDDLLLRIDNDFYTIFSGNEVIDLNSLAFEKTFTYEDLHSHYLKEFSRLVHSEVADSLNDVVVKLGDMEKSFSTLDSLSREATVANKKLGAFGYELQSESSACMFKDIDSYIIKKKGDHYLFPKARIGTQIRKNNDGSAAIVETPPYVIGHYPHSFMRKESSGKSYFCFGDINFANICSQTYQPLDSSHFPVLHNDAVLSIGTLENVLKFGFRADYHPHRYLNPQNFATNHISLSRVNELSTKGIEICDNDRRDT